MVFKCFKNLVKCPFVSLPWLLLKLQLLINELPSCSKSPKAIQGSVLLSRSTIESPTASNFSFFLWLSKIFVHLEAVLRLRDLTSQIIAPDRAIKHLGCLKNMPLSRPRQTFEKHLEIRLLSV